MVGLVGATGACYALLTFPMTSTSILLKNRKNENAISFFSLAHPSTKEPSRGLTVTRSKRNMAVPSRVTYHTGLRSQSFHATAIVWLRMLVHSSSVDVRGME